MEKKVTESGGRPASRRSFYRRRRFEGSRMHNSLRSWLQNVTSGQCTICSRFRTELWYHKRTLPHAGDIRAFLIARGGDVSLITRDDLERVGLDVSPSAFDRLVAEAVRAMPPVHTGDSVHDLSAAEAIVLERGGFSLSADVLRDANDDPLARGAAEYAALLATALTPAQAAPRLGIDESRIRHRLGDRTLYGIKTPAGWRLPLFQFDPVTGGALPGIGSVFVALDPDLHPVSVQRWFLTPDADLEVSGRATSPRDWLRQGGGPTAIAPFVTVA